MPFFRFRSDDSVYMQDESDRQEYILNEFGLLFSGTDDNVGTHEWYYDQFLKSTLESTFHVLQRARLTPKQYADPVEIVRILSQVVSQLEYCWNF